MTVFTAENGTVFHRGVYMPPPQCERLLALFRSDAVNPADYFHNDAQRLADELERAMEEAGYVEERSFA